MASLAEAALYAVGGGTSAAATTAIDRAKVARDQAFQREGWGRQEKAAKTQREFQAGESEKQRGFQSEEAEKQRTFTSEQADIKFDRDKELAKIKAATGGKPASMKITQADEGLFATVGGKGFQIVNGQLIPLKEGQTMPVGNETTITPEEGESGEGFFSRVFDYIFSESGDQSLAEAAIEPGKPGETYGAGRTYVSQIQAEGDDWKTSTDVEVPERIFEGKPFTRREFNLARERYPNATNELIIKSLEAKYQ